MRLKRLELVFAGITLAFICFLGGFFVGQSSVPVNVESFGSLQIETSKSVETGEQVQTETKIEIGVSTQNPVVNIDTPVLPPGSLKNDDGKININTASKNELMDLPGIGPALADNIVEYRNNNGIFKEIEDIMKVSGIGTGRFDRIKDKIKT